MLIFSELWPTLVLVLLRRLIEPGSQLGSQRFELVLDEKLNNHLQVITQIENSSQATLTDVRVEWQQVPGST